MTATDELTQEAADVLAAEVEAMLDPVEFDDVYRDTRAGSVIALLFLSPPTPRPNKG